MYKNEFITLGQIFYLAATKSIDNQYFPQYKDEINNLSQLAETYHNYNGWFSEEFVNKQLLSLSQMLEKQNVEKFCEKYSLNEPPKISKRIKIIPAGNIPIVGFHDMMCVLLTGHTLIVKHSQKDKLLPMAVLSILKKINPELKDKIIEEQDGQRIDFEAIIATGSNNSARYFDYYFQKYPHIIRRNRNSVAIITGNETQEDYKKLSDDIFAYYGLGCRSVSKIYVPENYNFDLFFNGIFHQSNVINNSKYADNYDYNKAVYLMSEQKILDNGFLILKEDEGLSSPPGTVFWQKYSTIDNLASELKSKISDIQCVVSNKKLNGIETVPFGKAQNPDIDDFADGINTIEFLKNL